MTMRRFPFRHVLPIGVLIGLATGLSARAAPATVVLPGDRVFPESVTATSDGTRFVGSLASGGILRVPNDSAAAVPWIAPGAFGSRSIFGVLADERSGMLWACSNDVSVLGVPGPSQVTGSFLKGFDLKTGEGRVSVALPGSRTLCNDIAIGPDGSAYVTNSLAPDILRLAPGGRAFEVWATNPLFDPPAQGAGLDGIAFGADGQLYVDTFNDAELFRVAVKDGKAGVATKLVTSRRLVLADALRPTTGDTAFLMIEGGGRLDRVTISGDKAAIATLKDGLRGPTGVTETAGTAWVSEGQLSALFGATAPVLPFDLQRVPLLAH